MLVSKPIHLLLLIVLLLGSCAEEQKPAKLQHGNEDSLTALNRRNPQEWTPQVKSTKDPARNSRPVNVVGIGISLMESTYVRLDSSINAEIVERLDFADYVTTFGQIEGRGRNYDQNGWVRVETKDGKFGWALFKNFWSGSQANHIATSSDSVFSRPDVNSDFIEIYDSYNPVPILNCLKQNDQWWIKFRSRQERWLKVARLALTVDQAYYHFLGWFKHPNSRKRYYLNNRDHLTKTLKIIEAIESRIASTDTVYVQKYTMGPGGNPPVGAGAYVAYLKSKVYQQFGLYDDAIASLQIVCREF